eukprot:601714-Amphidinium_carterae.1
MKHREQSDGIQKWNCEHDRILKLPSPLIFLQLIPMNCTRFVSKTSSKRTSKEQMSHLRLVQADNLARTMATEIGSPSY